jgi:cytochrome b involved in lipid metabolism
MDLILGLPVHPLVVHAAAVFIPLSAIGFILVLFSEKIRKTYTPLVLAAVAIAVVSGVVASSSGEALAERVGLPADHAIQGERLRNVVLIFGALVAVWYFLQRSKEKAFAQSQLLNSSLKGVATIVAAASLVLTVVVGHSGASSAWKDRVAEAAPLSGDVAPVPGSTSGGTAIGKLVLSAQEVAKHNSASDCWSVVNGNVYNLTSYIQSHPGGQSVIKNICGKDGSAAFTNQHNKDGKPNSVLKSFYLGALGATISADASSAVIAPPASGNGEEEEEEEEEEGR